MTPEHFAELFPGWPIEINCTKRDQGFAWDVFLGTELQGHGPTLEAALDATLRSAVEAVEGQIAYHRKRLEAREAEARELKGRLGL